MNCVHTSVMQPLGSVLDIRRRGSAHQYFTGPRCDKVHDRLRELNFVIFCVERPLALNAKTLENPLKNNGLVKVNFSPTVVVLCTYTCTAFACRCASFAYVNQAVRRCGRETICSRFVPQVYVTQTIHMAICTYYTNLRVHCQICSAHFSATSWKPQDGRTCAPAQP